MRRGRRRGTGGDGRCEKFMGKYDYGEGENVFSQTYLEFRGLSQLLEEAELHEIGIFHRTLLGGLLSGKRREKVYFEINSLKSD